MPQGHPGSVAADLSRGVYPAHTFHRHVLHVKFLRYNYHERNPEEFRAALKGEPVEVKLLNWYPQPPAGGAR